jgi:hypothetical protein
MVIPSTANVSSDALVHLQQFAKDGLTVILSGGDPGYYPSKDGRGENTTMSALASLKRIQNVHSIATEDLVRCFVSLGHQPRVQVQTNSTWRPLWREDAKKGIDYIFIFADGAASTGQIQVTSSKVPYFFDLWTGEQKTVLHYQRQAGKLIIPLSLASNQTMIIALSDQPLIGVELPSYHAIKLPLSTLGYSFSNNRELSVHVAGFEMQTPLILSTGNRYQIHNQSATAAAFPLTGWNLTAEHWEAPKNLSDALTIAVKHNTTHQLPELVSWTEIPTLVNVSGIGYYNTTFEWPPVNEKADGAYLKFPAVKHALRVYVNGHLIPQLDFSAPQADIAAYLKHGINDILAVVPTTMWNYLRTMIDKLKDGGQDPIPGIATGFPLPDHNEVGLIGMVEVVPYQVIKVSARG